MKIKGIGTEVIRIRFEDVRLLASLPLDVEVVAALAPPHRHQYGDGWCNDPTFYLQIRHRYCVRCPDGSALMIDYLQNFLRRYAEIKADEDSKRGQRVPKNDEQGIYGDWEDDDEAAPVPSIRCQSCGAVMRLRSDPPENVYAVKCACGHMNAVARAFT